VCSKSSRSHSLRTHFEKGYGFVKSTVHEDGCQLKSRLKLNSLDYITTPEVCDRIGQPTCDPKIHP